MVTSIKWHVANFNYHPKDKTVKSTTHGFLEEAVVETLLDEDYSAYRGGQAVLSPIAQKIQTALDKKFDTVVIREINGVGDYFPHHSEGSEQLEASLMLAGLE